MATSNGNDAAVAAAARYTPQAETNTVVKPQGSMHAIAAVLADTEAEPTPASASGPKAVVLQLVRTMKRPVHIAALSVGYKNKTGRTMKQDHKGGMLRFLRDVCANDLVVLGEGNDSFVRVATPASRTSQWLRERVTTCGPILISMLGRMFHEEFGRHFSDEVGEGVNRFLRKHFEQEFVFEAQKGQVRRRRRRRRRRESAAPGGGRHSFSTPSLNAPQMRRSRACPHRTPPLALTAAVGTHPAGGAGRPAPPRRPALLCDGRLEEEAQGGGRGRRARPAGGRWRRQHRLPGCGTARARCGRGAPPDPLRWERAWVCGAAACVSVACFHSRYMLSHPVTGRLLVEELLHLVTSCYILLHPVTCRLLVEELLLPVTSCYILSQADFSWSAALLPERAPFDVIVFQFPHVGADEVCDGM